MTIRNLGELYPKQCGVIVKVRGTGRLRQRMMDMGLVKGTEVQVVRFAPLGDPIEFNIKGYHLSLRKREAQDILVEMNEG
jgi:Fe2+ transport system protein FeoA